MIGRVTTRLQRRIGMLAIRAELSMRVAIARAFPSLQLPPNGCPLPYPRPRIAFNAHPVLTSWGGGNQWLLQLARHLAARGCSVRFTLDAPADIVFIAEANPANQNYTFGLAQIKAAKQRNPMLRCIHRINECDKRKETTDPQSSSSIDRLLAEANQLSDFTVFVSGWLRELHSNSWFNSEKPNAVIINGANTAVFAPAIPPRKKPANAPYRIVTHHWSDHWNKGFREYQRIDQAIASGELKNCELWIIGRWPKEITWQAAKTFAPRQGPALADLLKQCDLYITASRWEPGAMHYVEGAQCGLPVVYHRDTGGAPEVVSAYGVVFDDDPVTAVKQALENYHQLQTSCLTHGPSGERMCSAYLDIVMGLFAPGTSQARSQQMPINTPETSHE